MRGVDLNMVKSSFEESKRERGEWTFKRGPANVLLIFKPRYDAPA